MPHAVVRMPEGRGSKVDEPNSALLCSLHHYAMLSASKILFLSIYFDSFVGMFRIPAYCLLRHGLIEVRDQFSLEPVDSLCLLLSPSPPSLHPRPPPFLKNEEINSQYTVARYLSTQ